MQTTIDTALSEFTKPTLDPEFYAAKRALRKAIPAAQMIELDGKTVTVVMDGETQKYKI